MTVGIVAAVSVVARIPCRRLIRWFPFLKKETTKTRQCSGSERCRNIRGPATCPIVVVVAAVSRKEVTERSIPDRTVGNGVVAD